MDTNELHPVSVWVRKNVRDVYAARAPVRPSLQEVMWRLREGEWFKRLMVLDAPPSASNPTVQDAVVALSSLFQAIEEHGPYRIPFDIDQLADLRRILDRDVDPVIVCEWLRTFRRPIVCMYSICNSIHKVYKKRNDILLCIF
jgi:hypothetical protein